MAEDLSPDPDEAPGFYSKLTLAMQALMVLALVLLLIRRDWEDVFLTAAVLLLTLIPTVLSRRYRVFVPPDFQLAAVGFMFLSLFLGSVADWYYHIWWWDIMLHLSSGFLLGIVGWIVLFFLNETDRLPEGITPAFLCFFGVTFAVFLGVLWEIFEFTVDQIWPWINMQSNETGVVDTMHDLIVDTVGAVIVAFVGWGYFKSGKYSFLIDRVKYFIQKNPHMFPRTKRRLARVRERAQQND